MADKRDRPTPFHKEHCLTYIQKLWDADTLAMFHHPVSATEVPDYYTVIKCPIDLSSIKEKIEKGEYEADADVEADVALMITNALEYNEKHSPWYEQAKKMRSSYVTLAKQCGLAVDDDTSFIPKKKFKDDERTLRVEEEKNKENFTEVMGELKKESELSIEELRAKYAHKEEEDSAAEEEEDEDEEDDEESAGDFSSEEESEEESDTDTSSD
ncbi:bromodomain protein [Angomonas deanei]|uniref:Bromodomain, putative n=1 Tax=Angomonas deanei TaxID=59799 RepID=S9VM95_9TRYP|nr:bromodomain protein [Angomonas deanei]EPY41998.1 bromodomain protein [Angomonas deanei]CAD2214441.1 Bromodomain, putative [Angomonas deanei]|eukprot:EPY39646.1 bromodomain protein [Angomonas deanei]